MRELNSENETKKIKILIGLQKPENANSPYFMLEKKFPIELTFVSFINIQPIPLIEFKKQQIDLTQFTYILFTTKNSLDYYFKVCASLKIKPNPNNKYFCLKEEIAQNLQKHINYRKRKVFISEDGTSIKLFEKIKKIVPPKDKILYIISENQQDNNILNWAVKNKIKCTTTYMYRTIYNDFLEIYEKNKFDIICFYTPSSIKSFFHQVKKFKQGKLIIGTFGENTNIYALNSNLLVSISAPNEYQKNMCDALDCFLKKNYIE